MPGPLSATVMRITPAAASQRLVTRMRRGAGWSCSDCCALMIRLSSTWCSWSASARMSGMSVGEIERHLDAARANRVAGDVERRGHDVVDRHRAAFGLLLPGHREKGSHDARAALGGGADLQRRSLRRRIALLLEQDRARHDDRKRIVELVRDAGQQRAERGELLALIQRFALPRRAPPPSASCR